MRFFSLVVVNEVPISEGVSVGLLSIPVTNFRSTMRAEIFEHVEIRQEYDQKSKMFENKYDVDIFRWTVVHFYRAYIIKMLS